MEWLLAFLEKLLGAVASVSLRASCIFLALMFALINGEVLGRYIVGYSTLIAEEFVGYFFAWMTFLGFAMTLRNGQFLRVEIALRRLPVRVSNLLQGIAALLGAALCLVLAYCATHTVWLSFTFGSVSLQVSETPLVIPQAIMPLGMVLLALNFLNEGLQRFRRQPTTEVS
jgi:TRAP-type C4-dicarboxylate transport system permease small subunit